MIYTFPGTNTSTNRGESNTLKPEATPPSVAFNGFVRNKCPTYFE